MSTEKNLKENEDQCTLCGVSVSATVSNTLNTEVTTDTTIWSGGWVTDNFETYYLDKDMVKHYR